MSTVANTQAEPAVQGPSSFAMIRTLAGISLISGLLLSLVYQYTAPIIKKNEEERLRNAIFAVIPGATKSVVFEVQDSGSLEAVEEPTGRTAVFAGYNDEGELMGVALRASAQGYGDVVRSLYGYSPDKELIIGFKVLFSVETPGLGDKIMKDPEFQKNFEALDVKLDEDKKTLVNEIELVKNGTKTSPWQIDGITGATISSKAVTKSLQQSTKEMLPLVHEQLATLKEGA